MDESGERGKREGVSLNTLEIVVIGQFFSRGYASFPSEESDARFSGDGPHQHLAVRIARMIHKASHGATSGINDHLLGKGH